MSGGYFVAGRPAGYDAFQSRALDPAASVVISACAGAGKTTLLVGRIVRALLEGCEPGQVLAVTFTRKAAAEMRARLMGALRELALGDEPAALELLLRFALPHERATRLLPAARLLYERVLTDARGPTIATFHSWFWHLLQLAPAAAGVPLDADLSADDAALADAARLDWLERLRDPAHAGLRADFDALVGALGERRVDDALQAALRRRVELLVALDESAHADAARCASAAARMSRAAWSDLAAAVARFSAGGADIANGTGIAGAVKIANAAEIANAADVLDAADVADAADVVDAADLVDVADGTRLAGAADGFGGSDEAAARAALRGDPAVRAGMARFAQLLSHGSPPCGRLAAALDAALVVLDDGSVPLEQAQRRVRDAVLTRAGAARAWSAGSRPSAAFSQALAAAGGEPACQVAWQSLAARLAAWSDLVDELHALRVNDRLMRVAADRIAHFQAFKRARRAVDFGDVELMAMRLVRDESAAASVQARLDARYAQLLFDEFQDTSALQWRVLSDWLSGYGGAGLRPAVCIVGDVKQAIYRFRRADSRVFEAARALLVDTFDAVELATDTTWRVSPVVLDRINACLGAPGAPGTGYRRHATRRDAPGLAWRLPLAEGGDVEGGGGGNGDGDRGDRDRGDCGEEADARGDEAIARSDPDAADRPPAAEQPQGGAVQPRDWFDEPRLRDRRHRQFIEGIAIARAIRTARDRLTAAGHPVRWRDVLVLARRRSHFARYEQALRAAGIPVVSDRLGGLLDRLEVSDLLALLRWLWRPADDLALVQVLKSPLFGIDDATIATLGRERGTAWWDRLQRRFLDPDTGSSHSDGGLGGGLDGKPGSARLRTAHAQLAQWRALSDRLPVHALLDRIIADRDAYARYAAAVPPPQREVVRANLDALLGLALDLDGGRFPSLPGFLDAVRRLRRAGEHDAPGEGIADGIDAVQLMTIHGAKGLEAEIVVLADANGAARNEGGWRPLVGWMPPERAPRHVSFVHGSRRHPSRLAWLDAEAQAARIEDWNLLYVALTRARSALIVSGARNDRAAPDNWYARLQPVAPLGDADGSEAAQPLSSSEGAPGPVGAEFVWRRYRPEPLDGGGRSVAAGAMARLAALDDALQRGLEALSEVGLSEPGARPMRLRAVFSRAALDSTGREQAFALVARLLALPALRGCFDGSAHAAEPLDVFDPTGRLLRIDRWVELADEDWIVDWQAPLAAAASIGQAASDGPPAPPDDGHARLAARRAVMAALSPGRRLRTVLVHADAATVSFDPDLR